MLIEFTVGNFRSFKEPVTLSMVAAKLTATDPQIDINNTVQVDDDLTLLTSAAVYGANASGKSNLVKALGLMRRLVIYSSIKSQVDDPINTIPFRLDHETEDKPSFFEVVFHLDGIPYRYGFEVTTKKVETEWLFNSPRGKEAKLFTREGSEISLSRTYRGGSSAKNLTRSNALFLSVAAQFNGETATKVLGWFKSLNVISGLEDRTYSGFTVKMFSKNSTYRSSILELIQGSDVGIDNVVIERTNINDPEAFPNDMPDEVKELILKQMKSEELVNFKSIHQKHCENGTIEEVEFAMREESEGTKKLFYLSGPIIDTLINGKVLVIDEIEARMHTLLSRKLISLFNSPETNPKHAQLIFATHDTNLLSNKFIRRDQIWFVEKDEFGASHLYSLAELKVRNNDTYEKDYLLGKYGGIPILGEVRQTIIELGQDDEDAAN
ncbi:MAG TPA: abortive infection protein [Anaerolineaceae bacterium]|nr:abortive infection protein [Anaerolineaceae bacterium]